MARYALLFGTLVVNVVDADSDWVNAHAPGALLLGPADRVAPRWRRQGGSWVEPDPPPDIPQAITAKQMRRALLDNGYLEQIETIIAGLKEPHRSRLRVDWQNTTEFKRDDPTIAALAPLLGLTDRQLDRLFIAAANF